MTQNSIQTGTAANPLMEDWTTSDGVPPFDRIRPEHFRPAFARALAEHEAEIAAIEANAEPPNFANTIEALELSGRALERVNNVFHILAGADTNEALLALERELSPQLALHWNTINASAALFRRVDALMQSSDAERLNAEQKRVLERYHTGFRRAGAALDDAAKKRLAEIIERLAPRSAPRSARTCSPTSKPSRFGSATKQSLPACLISCARR